MAMCAQCSKTFHFCGSCDHSNPPDEYFCFGSNCENDYKDQNGISKVGALIQDLFGKHVDAATQKEIWTILCNNDGETGQCLLVQELKYACFTAPKSK